MSSSKSNKKNGPKNVNLHPHTIPPVGGAHALPEVGAPTPPADASPVVRNKGRYLVKAHRAQLDVALEAAGELRKSTHFPQIFGARFAVAGDVADALEFAARWSREAKAAAAWASYARQQSELAWDYTNGVLEKLRPPFLAASGGDSSLGNELHAFARLLQVRSEAAKRAAVTRKANKKAQPPQSKGASPPTPSVAAPGATTVVNGAGKTAVNGAAMEGVK